MNEPRSGGRVQSGLKAVQEKLMEHGALIPLLAKEGWLRH